MADLDPTVICLHILADDHVGYYIIRIRYINEIGYGIYVCTAYTCKNTDHCRHLDHLLIFMLGDDSHTINVLKQFVRLRVKDVHNCPRHGRRSGAQDRFDAHHSRQAVHPHQQRPPLGGQGVGPQPHSGGKGTEEDVDRHFIAES